MTTAILIKFGNFSGLFFVKLFHFVLFFINGKKLQLLTELLSFFSVLFFKDNLRLSQNIYVYLILLLRTTHMFKSHIFLRYDLQLSVLNIYDL